MSISPIGGGAPYQPYKPTQESEKTPTEKYDDLRQESLTRLRKEMTELRKEMAELKKAGKNMDPIREEIKKNEQVVLYKVQTINQIDHAVDVKTMTPEEAYNNLRDLEIGGQK